VEVLKARQKEKKDMLEQVKKYRKGESENNQFSNKVIDIQ